MVEGDLFPEYLMMPMGATMEARIPASVFVSDWVMECEVKRLVFLDILDVRLSLQM